MERQAGRRFLRQLEDAQVGNEGRVRADVLKEAQVVVQPFQIAVPGNDIDGDVDFLSPLMSEGQGFFHFFRREIAAIGPEAEAFPREVDRVRAVADGHFQFFHIARRREKLDFFHKVSFLLRETARPSPAVSISVS